MTEHTLSSRLIRVVIAVETAADARIGSYLRNRPGWAVTVVPYVGHGTRHRVQHRARIVARPLVTRRRTGRGAGSATGCLGSGSG